MTLTDCSCEAMGGVFRDGGRVVHASTWSEAARLIAAYQRRDRQRVADGLPPLHWGVHLGDRHCV